MSKEQFLKNEYIPLLKKLKGDEKGNFGKLSPQGMIEHMSDAFGNAYGRVHLPLHTQENMVPRFREFALSDKPFKENTPNAYMAELPPPFRHANIPAAITELEGEIKAFFAFYKSNPGLKKLNPFFGEFSYEDWLHLLHKHANHHLKQFNLV
jgi:hypothetical protein